jgi:hypothetical protein
MQAWGENFSREKSALLTREHASMNQLDGIKLLRKLFPGKATSRHRDQTAAK